MAEHLRRGQRGEALAAQYFRTQGYDVVAHNFRHGRAEIDLIVRKESLLIFVEVKTRSSIRFGYPEATLQPAQTRRIVAAADQYLHLHPWTGHIRFDIVAVVLSPEGHQLDHFPDAFW